MAGRGKGGRGLGKGGRYACESIIPDDYDFNGSAVVVPQYMQNSKSDPSKGLHIDFTFDHLVSRVKEVISVTSANSLC